MKDLIKEVALEVARKMRDDSGYTNIDLVCNSVEFATAFLAELSKRAEASCVAFQHEDTGRTTSVAHDEADDFERLNQRWFKVGPLFTFPPIHDIEAIENRVAEAICEMLRHKDKNCFGAHNYYLHAANCVKEGEWRKYK